MDTIELTSSHDGCRVTTHPGQRILVRLAELPSTGYRWRALPGAEVICDDFASDSAIGIGGGGMRTFTLIAGEAAQELRFELIRDWLPEMPERTFCCHIEPALNPGDKN